MAVKLGSMGLGDVDSGSGGATPDPVIQRLVKAHVLLRCEPEALGRRFDPLPLEEQVHVAKTWPIADLPKSPEDRLEKQFFLVGRSR